MSKKNKDKLHFYELNVDGVTSKYQLGFSSKEELSFEQAKEYAYKIGLFYNEDDKYYVSNYSKLSKEIFNGKYN